MVRKFIKKTKDEGVRDLTTLRNLTVEFSKEYCGKSSFESHLEVELELLFTFLRVCDMSFSDRVSDNLDLNTDKKGPLYFIGQKNTKILRYFCPFCYVLLSVKY